MGKEKSDFSVDIDPKLYAELRIMADAEGRDLRVIINEALRKLVSSSQAGEPSNDIDAHLDESVGKFGALYKKLAE